MYAKTKNKTALQSKHMITDAFFQLMKRKKFELITITEICEEAAIGRKTFYRNFELREDVIDFQLDLMLEEYVMEMEGLDLDQLLKYHFLFVKKYADILITLYHNNLNWMSEKKFGSILPKTMPIWTENPLEQTYRIGYIVAGIEAVQRTWIERGCQESVDEVMGYIHRAMEKQVPVLM